MFAHQAIHCQKYHECSRNTMNVTLLALASYSTQSWKLSCSRFSKTWQNAGILTQVLSDEAQLSETGWLIEIFMKPKFSSLYFKIKILIFLIHWCFFPKYCFVCLVIFMWLWWKLEFAFFHKLCISAYNLHENSEGIHKSAESEIQITCQQRTVWTQEYRRTDFIILIMFFLSLSFIAIQFYFSTAAHCHQCTALQIFSRCPLLSHLEEARQQ